MSRSNLDFYRARAAQCRDEASATSLSHVRERCDRSEAAWNELALREERMIREREGLSRRKSEASEAADMLRVRATECRALANRTRTGAAKDAFNLLATQFDEQANGLDHGWNDLSK